MARQKKSVLAILFAQVTDKETETENLAKKSASFDLKRAKKQIKMANNVIDFAQEKMNKSSVADLGQICTISKMRIITPTKAKDYLAGECLSASAMIAIQEKIQLLFFQN